MLLDISLSVPWTGPRVVSKGIPSKKLDKEMRDLEEKRLGAQRDTLGMEGLEKKAEELQKAMDSNDVEPPDEVLRYITHHIQCQV